MGTFLIGSTAGNDGTLYGEDGSYANVRGGGAATNSVDTAGTTLQVGQDAPSLYRGWEGFLDFDLATVSGLTAITATLALNVASYVTGGSTFTTLYAMQFDYGASLTYADWQHYINRLNAGLDPTMATLATAAFTIGTRQDLVTAGGGTGLVAAINAAAGGHLRMVLCTDRQANGGSVPTGSEYCTVSTADSGTANLRPQLTIVTPDAGHQLVNAA